MTADPGSPRPPHGSSTTGLQVAVVDAAGRPVPQDGLGRWLIRVTPLSLRGVVTIALVSDARMRALNRAYRGTDRCTDVLSFSSEGGPADPVRARRGGRAPLGDIVIATGTARRQARQAGHDIRTELRILALHGLLHLIGYDHEAPSDAGAMARIERRWRRKGGLPDGLIERAHGAIPAGRVSAVSRRRPTARGQSGASIGSRRAAPARPGEGPRTGPRGQSGAGIGSRRAAPARPGEGPRSKQ